MPLGALKILFSILALGLALTPAPATAKWINTQPWALAVVVESSAAMDQPWQGATRNNALEPALEVELRSLPARVTAAVYISKAGEARTLVAPSPANSLKRLSLTLTRKAGPRSLKAGIQAALAWLKKSGGGSLVVVGAGGGGIGDSSKGGLTRAQVDGLKLPGGIFVHTVALAGPDGSGPLELLALKGGGAFFAAPAPGRLSSTLHPAFLTAITPARLRIPAHNSENQPLALTYGLANRRHKAVRRKALTSRPAQLMPGVYRLSWPPGAGMGPLAPPAKVKVAHQGTTTIWAGGQGQVNVQAKNAQGEDLPWRLSLTRTADGAVLLDKKTAPLQITVPAGDYRLQSLHPSLAWALTVGAGQKIELLAGPMAKLLVNLPGPGGELRVPYKIEDLLGMKPAGTGYTGSAMRLLPGRYRLTLQTAPPLVLELHLMPGQDKKLPLPPVGAILVTKVSSGGRFTLLNAQGTELGQGPYQASLPVLPGKYQIRLRTEKKPRAVTVTPGQITKIVPPR